MKPNGNEETRRKYQICTYHPNKGTVSGQRIWCMKLDKCWLPSHCQLSCEDCCNTRNGQSNPKDGFSMNYTTTHFCRQPTLPKA